MVDVRFYVRQLSCLQNDIGQSAAELWPKPMFNMAAVRCLEF